MSSNHTLTNVQVMSKCVQECLSIEELRGKRVVAKHLEIKQGDSGVKYPMVKSQMSTTLVTRENLRPQSCGPRTTHYYKPVCAQIFLVGSQK